jgi:hypothetical protein
MSGNMSHKRKEDHGKKLRRRRIIYVEGRGR